MGFFTVGNLLTLGICGAAIVLFRYLDRNNRSVDLLRKHGKQLKDDLESFAEEKAQVVKDYGVELDAKKAAAKAVLDRLNLTEEDLSDKASAVEKIGERISGYDKSLEELQKMTSRVEENLLRLRDESAFVGEADKKLSEIKNRIASLETEAGSMELRIERENAEILEKTKESLFASVASTVQDLQTSADAVERQVEAHRAAVDKIETERKAQIARDVETINNALKDAVEKAGVRSGKIEEQALEKINRDAVERVKRFHETVEKKMDEFQETAKAHAAEVQDLIKSYKSEQKEYQAEWKRDIEAVDAAVLAQRENLLGETQSLLSNYKEDEARQWERLSAMADEAANLDAQLRIAMADAEARVRAEFAAFEEAQKAASEKQAAEYRAAADALRGEMAGVESELAALKEKAYENVSAKLQVFEEDFAADLSRRSGEIDSQLGEWRAAVDRRLDALGEDAETERNNLEEKFRGELREKLERLAEETAAFEESIRGGMAETERSLAGLRDELKADFEDSRILAQNAMQAELGRYSLNLSEQIKKNQRELEDWQEKFGKRLREAEEAIEDTRLRARDLLDRTGDQVEKIKTEIDDARKVVSSNKAEIISRTEEQVRSLSESVDEAERRIREFTQANRLFEKAEEHKRDLERKIEDLKDAISGLDQRKAEAAAIEQQCVTVRRLGDEVNAKMNRFLAEEQRLSVMESNFNRLIATSQAVDEKLRTVMTSDDLLQEMQVKIRKLDDAMTESDDRFARLERKNAVLDEATRGIEKNFTTMEETEKALRHFIEKLDKADDDLADIRPAIERLADANDKAGEAAEKLGTLDDSLAAIERRIADMNRAREWLARAETRFEELNKETLDHFKLLEGLLDSSKTRTKKDAAPPVSKRENIIRLKRMGWDNAKIAESLKISRGEVELVLEMGIGDVK